jgi:hypothetical protein
MAATKYLDYDGLLYFWSLIKAKLALKADAQSVTAGSYGPSADASPAHSGTFKVPYVQVTSQGVVTAISEKTITLPASGNTDTKVKQNLKATSDTGKYPILLKNSTTATDNPTGEANYAAAITVQPSTGTVKATKFEGAVTGNADSATEFSSAQSVTLTGDVTGTASSKAGWSIATTLADSGVAAGTVGNTTQQTPSHGGTFNIPYVTVDAKGRVTAAGTTTVKLPADNNTDTLVTQNVSTANEEHPILLTVTKDAVNNQGAKTSIFAAGVKVNPSTGTITATKFSGAVQGKATDADHADEADVADKVTNDLVLKIKTGTSEGTSLYTYNGSAGKTLDIKQGSNITLTAAANSLTIAGVGDTKNTAGSTDSSSKLFIIGATSQAANPQTYSQDTAYVGTDGCLYSNSKKCFTSDDAYTKTEIDNKLTSAMHYKGSKNTYADLPATGNAVGDFYNITQTGENYAWTGDTWDVTGSIVDLQSITNAEIDTVVAS